MTTAKRMLPVAVIATAVVVALTACGGTDSATRQPTTTAATGVATNREVALVSGVRPLVDRLTEALRKGDVAASRQALEAYDSAWNGIEVYVNVRSKDARYVKPGEEDLYATLETDLQVKITDGLDAAQPNTAALVPLSEQLGRKYDDAIARSQAGPPLSPLFDDVATVRIVRADLRIVTSALGANDLAKAKASFVAFKRGYPSAKALIKVRSVAAEQETTSALAAADAKLQPSVPSADDLKPLVATLTDRYNFGLRLLNAAARNADPARSATNDDDLTKVRAFNDIQVQLTASMVAWTAGDFAKAAAAFASANTSYALVQPALAARASDADVTRSLGGYGAFIASAGDAAKATAAHKTAVESVLVAQQALVGQFWTDRKLQDYLAVLPTS